MQPMYVSIQQKETGNRIKRLLKAEWLHGQRCSREPWDLKIHRLYTNGWLADRYQALTISLF
ncbi:MAG: hypothetical protein ACLUD0_03445 [Eubacterium ramulus]